MDRVEISSVEKLMICNFEIQDRFDFVFFDSKINSCDEVGGQKDNSKI